MQSTLVKIFLKTFSQTFTIKGRSSRSEFWYFAITMWIINSFIEITFNQFYDSSLILELASFVLCIPSIAQTFRRLHDFDCSGWALLALLIPFINIIFILAIYLKKGDPNINEYGDIPEAHNLELIDKIFIFGSLLSIVILFSIDRIINI
jgi:uncharacterized membrane protein YhaH (DUF805 family)